MSRISSLAPSRRLALAYALALGGPAAAAEKVTFEEHVRPILRENCAGCHSQDDAAGGFASDGFDAVLAGGAGGEVVAAGDLGASRLWRLVTHAEEPKMPPGGDKLADDQLAAIRAWIEGGLLKDSGSRPVARKGPSIAAVDPARLGKPAGEPATPEGLFREPVLTAAVAGPVDSLAASPWAPLLAVPWQRQVSLYDSQSAELLGIVPYLDGTPRVVRFSRDGSLLLVAGGIDAALGTAAVIDVKSGARLATLGDEVDAVLAADISPDNALVAIGGPKKKVRVLRVADGSVAYTCEKHTDWITSVAFSPDGKLLATADRSAGLRLWQAARGHERGDLRGHTDAVTALAWRRDGGLLASAAEDGSVRLWNPDGAEVKSIAAHAGGTQAVDFAPDGGIVTAGRDRVVKLWAPDGSHRADLTTTPDLPLAATFTHDGARVVVADWTGAVTSLGVESKAAAGAFAPNPPTLRDRVEAAEGANAEAEKTQSAASALVEGAVAALDTGRAAHAEHAARFVEAQQAAANAGEAVAEAEMTLAQRVEAAAATAHALASVGETLAASERRLERETKSEESEADLGALTAEVEAARNTRDAAAATARQADALRGESAKSLDALRVALREADGLVAAIAGKSAGLPDLAALEAALAERKSQSDAAATQLAAARAARDTCARELGDYAAAGERLAAERAAAGARRDAQARAASETTAAAERAAAAKGEADRGLAGVLSELADLRAKLRDSRAAAQASGDALREAEAAVARDRDALSAAERDAAIGTARLEAIQAVERFRAERAAARSEP